MLLSNGFAKTDSLLGQTKDFATRQFRPSLMTYAEGIMGIVFLSAPGDAFAFCVLSQIKSQALLAVLGNVDEKRPTFRCIFTGDIH